MSLRFNPGLYLVTDSRLCGQRGVSATVRAAVAGGVTAVQLRDPEASTRELYEMASELLQVLTGTGIPLFINDRLDVALAVGAQGVHLGQSDLPVVQARRIAGSELLIGCSVSTIEHVIEANQLSVGIVDYLGIGPVFATKTKPDAAAPLGIDGLRGLRAVSVLPCVAIGGITVATARQVMKTGVAGICVVSEICAAGDPETVTRQLREEVMS